MYQVEFLPIAKKDIDEVIYYVANNLRNLSAAKNLSNSFIDGVNSILVFPFGVPIYKTFNKLKNEYRCIKIKNFLMFYTINEKDKKITIVRVLYQKMDINNILE
jgi:plasmid stabilization system protein ParE